jgi:hypothetical protein
MGICKSWADGSRVSTFVSQFGFRLPGRTNIYYPAFANTCSLCAILFLQMIHSRNNAFGFWLCAIVMVIYILLAVCCISQFYFDFEIIKIGITSQRSFNAWIAICGIACLIFGGLLSFRASLITINSDSEDLKYILFKNIFSRRTRTYNFKELDGFIRTRLWHKQFSTNKTLCLIKGGKVVKIIDNFFYSNVDELETGLKHLPYLGFKPMGFVNSWRVLFGQQIIKM